MKMLVIPFANSEGSSEPAHRPGFARAIAVRSHNMGTVKKLQTKSHNSDPTECARSRV